MTLRGDNPVGAWILRQHPVVMIALSAGLAMGLGALASSAAVWGISKAKAR